MRIQALSRRVAVSALAVAMSSVAAPAFALALASVADCDDLNATAVLQPAAQNPALPAQAVWLDRRLLRWPRVDGSGRFRLYYSASAQIVARPGSPVRGADGALELDVYGGKLSSFDARRFSHFAAGSVLALRGSGSGSKRLANLFSRQWVLVQEDAQGTVRQSTAAQIAAALDDAFGEQGQAAQLGVRVRGAQTSFALWAPTATAVHLCRYRGAESAAEGVTALDFDPHSGVWRTHLDGDLSSAYYTYLVDVFVRGVGMVRNRVTDPYSISLNADSRRSYIADLDAAVLKPAAWDATPVPALAAPTDMTVYELHVRDFSINDPSVSAANRGKFLAFTESASNGMRHLRALAVAGITDVHLLPVFDFATVPERDCVSPAPRGAPADTAQQALVAASKAIDCFNWGYDPYHYNAAEGSYASDANDGARRIVEMRAMVQALHRAGLRVGMDVVYNHTSASGQAATSVLDRIVPGYYQRLNANGDVETSTCCANTATENRMMAKLMIDSVLGWARDYRIDSFRFDLMGHQPRLVMEQLKARLRLAIGRDVQVIGEGWNFGEVADDRRFVQASQLELNGSGIGTFSDRARDAIRGGSAGDSDSRQISAQGYINGLVYDRNALAPADLTTTDLMRTADLVRVGLAGSIRSYVAQDHRDQSVPLERVDYNGQPAGYASEPDEVVNYIENHDNQTLFDINAFKLPTATSREDRARVQMLGAAINAFSQGIAYFHAGVDLLRSKSMDRNSYDSGDWFNRIDWSCSDNYFGSGLPPQGDNGSSWTLMQPLLANPDIKPGAGEIAWTRDAFRDLLRIRRSSSLFRLRRAADIRVRLKFLNTGSGQEPTLLVGHLDGNGYADAGFSELLYLINVDKAGHQIEMASERDKDYVLHPVQADPAAADTRPARLARYQRATGSFSVPARTAVVYVVP